MFLPLRFSVLTLKLWDLSPALLCSPLSNQHKCCSEIKYLGILRSVHITRKKIGTVSTKWKRLYHFVFNNSQQLYNTYKTFFFYVFMMKKEGRFIEFKAASIYDSHGVTRNRFFTSQTVVNWCNKYCSVLINIKGMFR